MIEFLKEYNISLDVIDRIKKENSSANLYNFSCNDEEIEKIINYFRELGINCINELLIYRIDLFFNSLDDIKERFAKYNSKDLVDSLNDDYSFIDNV